MLQEPFVSQAAHLWESINRGLVQGYLPATVHTNIYYVPRKAIGHDKALEVVDDCLALFETLPVNQAVLRKARSYSGSDFEDNVVIACAELGALDYIVARNTRDYRQSPISVIEPQQSAELIP